MSVVPVVPLVHVCGACGASGVCGARGTSGASCASGVSGACLTAVYLIIMELGQIFAHTNLRNWPKNSQQTWTKLLSAVRGVISTGISIVSLWNEGFPTFCLCLIMGRHLGFRKKLWNLRSRRLFANSSWGNAAMAFSLSSQFYVCGRTCYMLYSGNCCILGVGKWLGGETVVLQYPVWLLHNIDSNVKNECNNKNLFACPYFLLQDSA